MRQQLIYLLILISCCFLFNLAHANDTSLHKEIDIMQVKVALDGMYRMDQSIRLYMNDLEKKGYSSEQLTKNAEFMSYWKKIDTDNETQLKSIIAAHGWPVISVYGSRADHEAFMIVHHADWDRVFQEAMFIQLKPLVKKHETNPRNYAYLEDRININHQQLQRYGTQGRCIGHGKWQPDPIADPTHLDQRRLAAHMPSFAEYQKEVVQFCP